MSSCPRILVVEDDFNYVDLLNKWFNKMPYQFTFCYTGEQAVNLLATETYEMVWVDLKLPGISGVEVLRHAEDTPVIVVTGYPDSELADQAFKIGVGLIYRKPNNIQELERFLNTFNLHHG